MTDDGENVLEGSGITINNVWSWIDEFGGGIGGESVGDRKWIIQSFHISKPFTPFQTYFDKPLNLTNLSLFTSSIRR